MMLATAVFISNLGGVLVAGEFWLLRRNETRLNLLSINLFVVLIGAFLMMLGALYRIAAITQPTYGHAPWMTSLGLLLLFIVAEVYFLA